MILMITKTLCYHQVYVADDMYAKYGDSFVFVQMREPLDWRVQNGQEGFERPYLITYSKKTKEAVVDLIKSADVLIYGEAPLKLIRHRSKKCLLFRMSENIFKDTQFKLSAYDKIKRFFAYKYLKTLTNNDHSYLLSCGAYAFNDFQKLGIFSNRALKWGYFPKVPDVSRVEIEKKFDNDIVELIWVSRLIKYKNPMYLIDLTKYLLNVGIKNFHITVIGDSGESEIDIYDQMKQIVAENSLSQYITLTGKINADKVFAYYMKAHVALFTADKSEGWSVGINEAMSCGCAVVSSNCIGAAPFLINKNNGRIFQFDSINDFCEKVEKLIVDKDDIKKMALNGYNTIHEIWNHQTAVNHLSSIIDSYLKTKSIKPLDVGPCSIAKLMNYDWYLEK